MVRFATTRLRTGPQIHYAERGETGGDAVVFLHGWPDSWFSFSRVMASLPQRYRSLAVDQRGFGDSERPAQGYSIQELAADAEAFLESLSIRRATLVGHSLGSFIARCVALGHPERVARLVLIGSGWSPVNAVTREVQASIRDLGEPVPLEFARDFQASTIHQPVPEAFFNRLIDESVKLPARLWRDVFDGLLRYDDVEELNRIAVPTLLMWGDRDALFSREEQDCLAAAIPGAELQIYSGFGHCPNWECPDLVAADLVSFISA